MIKSNIYIPADRYINLVFRAAEEGRAIANYHFCDYALGDYNPDRADLEIDCACKADIILTFVRACTPIAVEIVNGRSYQVFDGDVLEDTIDKCLKIISDNLKVVDGRPDETYSEEHGKVCGAMLFLEWMLGIDIDVMDVNKDELMEAAYRCV